MNLEFFGVSVQQIATYAGAALLSLVGGHEGLKLIGPTLSKLWSKLRPAAPAFDSAFAPRPGTLVLDLGDELGDATAGLLLAARFAKDNGNRKAVEDCVNALHELLDPIDKEPNEQS